MIAMAISLDPDVLIADEPTTALDVTVQAQIMELLADLQQQTGMGLILIPRSRGRRRGRRQGLGHVRRRDRGDRRYRELYRRPYIHHRGLMRSLVPRSQGWPALADRGVAAGPPPHPFGCPFHPRCDYAQDICRTDDPPLRVIEEDRTSACHFAEDFMAEELTDA